MLKRQLEFSLGHKRPDCVQVVIALVVTPEGFPLAYEVMAGNTSDRITLRGFLERIEKLYGKAERIWVMDRGIPTEEVLAEMRQSDPPVHYLVGTPKGRLTKYEKDLTERPWQVVREGADYSSTCVVVGVDLRRLRVRPHRIMQAPNTTPPEKANRENWAIA